MWAGYQIISGFGRGMTMQQPLTAIQVVLSKNDLAVGNSIMLFAQTIGGALFISFAQTIFSNQLKPALANFAPEVNAEAVLGVGATNFRKVVDEGSVEGVVLAYNLALTTVFVSVSGIERG
jgi:hypothetical protein